MTKPKIDIEIYVLEEAAKKIKKRLDYYKYIRPNAPDKDVTIGGMAWANARARARDFELP